MSDEEDNDSWLTVYVLSPLTSLQSDSKKAKTNERVDDDKSDKVDQSFNTHANKKWEQKVTRQNLHEITINVNFVKIVSQVFCDCKDGNCKLKKCLLYEALTTSDVKITLYQKINRKMFLKIEENDSTCVELPAYSFTSFFKAMREIFKILEKFDKKWNFFKY